MPMTISGRVMSVDIREDTPETKDRRAKAAGVEIEVYVARKKTEIIEAPLSLFSELKQTEETEQEFPVEYNAWAVNNGAKIGISFKLVTDKK